MRDTNQRIISIRMRYPLKYLIIISLLFISASALRAQDRTLTGTVVDVSGEPMLGVNVMNVNTNKGTITDMDGKFSLRIPQTAIIRFAFIG